MLIRKLSDNSKEYLDTYYEIVDSLKSQMFAVENSNSISHMFIEQILPHTNAGIELSENILKYTTDTDIENFAKNVVTQNNENLERLNSISIKCVCENNERDIKLYTRKSTELITAMITRLNSVQGTNNLNSLYLQSMMFYYEGFLALARNLLNFEICSSLKSFVDEQIIFTTNQLALIKNLLNIRK